MRNPLRAPGPGIPIEQRATLENQRERLVFVILRNAIPIVGILFLGWSAQDIIILYFADTLGAMWALITALAFYFTLTTSAPTIWARAYAFAVALFSGAFLTLFLSIPLGIPLWILLQIGDWSLQDSLASTDFVYGLVLIIALSLVGMLRHYQHIQDVTIEKSDDRREFGILMTRWIIILILIYLVGFLLGPYGVYVLVIAYAIATIYSELYPDRFERLLGPATYTTQRPASENPKPAKPRRKKR